MTGDYSRSSVATLIKKLITSRFEVHSNSVDDSHYGGRKDIAKFCYFNALQMIRIYGLR